jgi:hypothetical protein
VTADGDVASVNTRACPNCGVALSIDERYVTWCESCEWNLEPAESRAAPKSDRQLRQAARARKRGEALFRELSAKALERPQTTAARLASLVVALLVHAITFAVLALGVYVLVAGITHVSNIVFGVALILLSALLRPHLGKIDRRSITLTRRQAPHLYQLTDRVAMKWGPNRQR